MPEKIIQPDGSFIKMEYYDDGNVKATVDPLGNRTEYIYDNLNRVDTIIDPRGNPLSYKYTNTDKVKKIIDAEGNSNTFVYNDNGKLVEVWDQEGNITEYVYDEADQLMEIIDPLRGETRFEYDEKGNVVKITDANENVTVYEYDALDRLISVTDPELYTYQYAYDANGNLVTSTDPRGNITTYEYDSLNRVISITDANQGKTSYEYDIVGRIKKIINPLNYTTEYDYYDDGQIKSITDAMGNTTSYTYNLLGLVETITDANGAVTTYEYDSLGNITKLIDEEGVATRWEYDENSNVTKVIDALGNETSYTYDKLNRVKTIKNELGNKRTFEYTKMGQIAAITDENGNVTEYEYDALGNLIEVIDAKGHSTEYVYDKVGNLTEIHQYRAVDEETLTAITSTNDIQTVLQEVYSEDIEAELQTQLEDINETVTEAIYNQYQFTGIKYQPTYFEYDNRGLLTKEKDAEGNVKIYEYDENGNLIKEIDKEGYVTTYEYDPLNLVKKVNYNGEKQIEYKYNPLGQLIEMKDWLGTTSMELDPLGRVLKVTDFENKITEYTWTPIGEKESITYIDGTKVNYQYDKLGRMTKVEDAYGDITIYNYNQIGNLVERILPNGSRTEYQYDAISQIVELTEFNPTGKITDTFRYEYDNAGNRIKTYKDRYELDEEAEDWEKREEISYRYDALNQLIEVTTSNNQTRKYFYDTLGNRIRKEEWNSTQIQEAINYEYDILNRLINTYEDIEDGKTYRYDDRGNLTQVKSGGKIFNKYEYDETNSLVKVTDKHGAITEYIYDGFGNRIKSIIDLNHPGGGNRPDKDNNGNAYGHENENNGNAYGHDKDKGNPKPGWDHQNKRNNMEQNFVVDITSPYNNVLMIYGDHYQTQRYTYGIDRISMDMWMLEDEDNGWIPDKRGTHLSETPDRLYYLHDELGSTTKVIGENGKTSAHYNYDEFGRPLSFRKFDQNWPGPDNTFGYTGYQYDVSSELYYAQARYYMPEIGRFISEDPWQGTIAEPTTMNPYPYVQNNPIKYVDPLGLRPLDLSDEWSPRGSLSNTSSKDPLNKASEKVVEKQVNNESGWNCSIVSEGLGKVTTYSDQLVDFVAYKEGFSPKAVNNGKTIGYGFDFYLRPDIEINYLEDGVTISEAEAERLLRLILDESAVKLNSFLDENNLTVDQNSYDSMIDLFYNRNSNKLTQEVVVAMAMKDDYKVKSLLNDFDYRYAKKYIYDGNAEKAQAYVNRNPGLLVRREEEYKIYKDGYDDIYIP